MNRNLKMKMEINNALQQMIGFKIGKWDDIEDLIRNMGLTKQEWELIKDKEDSGNLDDEDIQEINLYFKRKKGGKNEI